MEQQIYKMKLYIISAIFIVMAVIAVNVYMFAQKVSSKLEKQNLEAKKVMEETDDQSTTVSLQTKYRNPLDADTDYQNPFSDYKNPFDE